MPRNDMEEGVKRLLLKHDKDESPLSGDVRRED